MTGITIQNSPQCHLKFDNCNGVLVHDVTISSPGDSPNTDGIHLQNSRDVLIYKSNLACGKILTRISYFHIFISLKQDMISGLSRVTNSLSNVFTKKK